MALKTATPDTGRERRRHPRLDVAAAIMVSPNGHPHHTTVVDLSASGARIGLLVTSVMGIGMYLVCTMIERRMTGWAMRGADAMTPAQG